MASSQQNSRRQTAFHFINVNPSSEQERSQTQHFVRSHVGKWTWDQIKRHPGQDSEDEMDHGTVSVTANLSRKRRPPDKSIVKVSSSSPSSSSSLSFADSPSDSRRAPQVARVTPEGESNLVSNTQTELARPTDADIHSIESFESISFDPFESNSPILFPQDFIDRCNTYSTSALWPVLAPRSPRESHDPISASWLTLSLQDSTLLTAFLFGSSAHRHVVGLLQGHTSTAHDKRLLELSELATIRMINQAIQDPSRSTSDAVILSVLCMASNTSENLSRHQSSHSPFSAPLRGLQSLDVYGGTHGNTVHQQGLVQLVEMRGGLENLKLKGLSAIISYADILTASRALARPHFSFISLTGMANPTLTEVFGFGLSDLERSLGRYGEVGFTICMAEVFHAMKEYTALVQAYEDGSILEPNMSSICDRRNLVQYHIASLPAGAQMGTIFQQTHPGYEACRLAAMIHGVGVTFPLPAHVAPLSTLARQLQAEVVQRGADFASSASVEMLLWVLVLGGIAATGQPERQWFATELGKTGARRRLSSWYDLKAILEQVMWLACACDAAGRCLWEEATRYGQDPLA